jgi:hypothetical protein
LRIDVDDKGYVVIFCRQERLGSIVRGAEISVFNRESMAGVTRPHIGENEIVADDVVTRFRFIA